MISTPWKVLVYRVSEEGREGEREIEKEKEGEKNIVKNSRN